MENRGNMCGPVVSTCMFDSMAGVGSGGSQLEDAQQSRRGGE